MGSQVIHLAISVAPLRDIFCEQKFFPCIERLLKLRVFSLNVVLERRKFFQGFVLLGVVLHSLAMVNFGEFPLLLQLSCLI